MKPLLFLCLLLSQLCFAQSVEKQLKRVTTIDEAAQFMETHPSLQGVVFNIYSHADTAAVYQPLFQKRAGSIFTQDGYTYKILSDTTATFHRVSYIYFDGTKLSRAQIDSTRGIILQKLAEGVPFSQLATQYTMEETPNDGNTGWFTDGTMVREFEQALKKHKAPEVYLLDIPRRGWYYVVKKTNDSAAGKRLTVLRIKAADLPNP